MLVYAIKRIIRGRGLFMSLFLSIALAATLFSGILQGADAIGVAVLDKTLESAYVDIITSAPDKNISKTRIFDIENIMGDIEGVEGIDHFVRWSLELDSPTFNHTIRTALVALPDDSTLFDGIEGADVFERGKIYIDASSTNSSDLINLDEITLKIETYLYKNPPGFEMRYYNFTVAGSVSLNDRVFQISTGRYNIYLRDLIQGRDEMGKRPRYNLIMMNEETLMDIMAPIFNDTRRPIVDVTGEAMISIDRDSIINPWDVQGSLDQINLIVGEINTNGAEYYYTPRSYISDLLTTIKSISNQMKTSTMLVALPVFFTAWYLGLTVNDVILGLRRREIGLFFTRGLTHRQVLNMLIFEGAIVSLLSSMVGIVAGAAVLTLIIPEMGLLGTLNAVSPLTVGVTVLFSVVLTILSIYRPAKRATEVTIVEALREHQSDDETIDDWQIPMITFLLGLYKYGMLIMGITVDQFQPQTSNLIITLLYSTWWGTDYLLGNLAPILLFWGFTKLFIIYAPWYQVLLSKIAGVIAGEAGKFSTLSSRRNMKRIAASTFMTALIVGYSTAVIGNIYSSTDFMNQAVKMSVGADSSIWLFEGDNIDNLMEKILEIEGVIAVAKETHFSPETGVGDTPIRAINPLEWREAAYMPDDWLDDPDAFEAMAADPSGGIMEKGAAKRLGLTEGRTTLTRLQSKVFPIKMFGFFGREANMYWQLQNPTIYVNEEFLSNVKSKFIEKYRIIVKLEGFVDPRGFKDQVEALSDNVERVDMMQLQIERSINNIYLAGPKRMEQLGVYFAGLVASLGIVLIVSTVIRSRIKELTIMSIRGFSSRQLAVSLLIDNVGMTVFAIVLGTVVGYASLYGQTELFNQILGTSIYRKIVFPPSAQLMLAAIIGLILVSTVAPILYAVRRISNSPDLKLEE